MNSSSSLTPQQQIAVELRGTSIHLSSGAGCGKTHVLTERYLSHLKDDGAEVDQIVAITFTERAARQMRERIRRAFTAERGRGAPESRARWDHHLMNLENAPISTIHAFCGNLLRQYAGEVDLDPQFDILDEVLSLNVKWATVREELQSLLLRDDEAGHSLRELTKLIGWYRVQLTLLRMIAEYNPTTWPAFLLQTEEQYRTATEAAKRKLLAEYIPYLRTGDSTIFRHLGTLLTTRYKNDELPAKLKDILLRLERLPEESNLKTAVAELLEQTKKPGELKQFLLDPNELKAVSKSLTSLSGTLKTRLSAFVDDEENNRVDFQVVQHFVRVAGELTLAYRRRKREKSVVDFDDLLILARQLVAENPEVRQTLADKYRFVLLDELQDTDPTQMQLIEFLCGAGLKFGKLFAVGDAKQSIYRFRGADVTLFDKLRGEILPEGRLDLSRNFRSQREILNFVNALGQPTFPAYVPLEAHHSHSPTVAPIEFLWTFPPEGEAAEAEEEEEGQALSGADGIRQREARFLAGRIAEMLASDEKRVWDSSKKEFRAPTAKDFTILFRSMSKVAIYEDALRERGLDYYLIGGKAFFAQQEIYDILNVLRVVENSNDAIALAGVLRSPMGGIDDETLILLAVGQEDLWAGLQSNSLMNLAREQAEAVERIRKNLLNWQSIKDRVGIAELLQRIIDDTGYDAALQFEFLGDRKLANLWKLIELARTFDESGLFTLAEFIERLAELVSRQPKEEQAATLPESADVIKLMTIHQSKGLEFPIVVVADFNRDTGANPEGNARWQNDFGCVANPPSDEKPAAFSNANWRLAAAADAIADWQEELRVLYVACTRAEDLLILSGGFAKDSNEADPRAFLPRIAPHNWTVLLGSQFDLRNGQYIGSATDMPAARIAVAISKGDSAEKSGKKTPSHKAVKTISMSGYSRQSVDSLPREIDLNAVWNIPRFALAETLTLPLRRAFMQMECGEFDGPTLLTCGLPIRVAGDDVLIVSETVYVTLDETRRSELANFYLLAWFGDPEKASEARMTMGNDEYRFEPDMMREFLKAIISQTKV